MQFDDVALIVVIALGVCLIAWLLWGRYAPLHLAVSDRPLSSADRQFGADIPDHSSLGKVGELVTALMHAKDGWRQLPSQPAGVHGLDGVFVRNVRGGNQFEVRIVETKCSRDGDPKSNYSAEQMADARVIEQLERLKDAKLDGEPYMNHQAIEAIIKAIRRGSMHVTKHFYAHMLGTGNTLVYSVTRDGQLIDQPAARVKRVSGTPHRLMLQALAIGLARLDAAGRLAP